MGGIVLIEMRDGGQPIRHHFSGVRVRVGRGADNELVLSDPSLSRTHLEFRLRDGAWQVEDCQSKHGTTVNGRPLRGLETLRPGSELRLGTLALLVELPGGSQAGAVHAEETSDRPPERSPGRQPVLVGSSAAMRAVREEIRSFATSDVTALVLGEPGTGKEVAARLLHDWSGRATGPFVIVNCPALTRTLAEAEIFGVESGAATQVTARAGKAQEADGGTLFFDEIGDLDPECQAKLLRFLQDRTIDRVGARTAARVRVDVRVVAATNKDLESEAEAGKFRHDLLSRIRSSCIVMPPLRERREDIPDLVAHFLVHVQPRPAGITDAALAELRRREHPGNVRDIEEAVKAAAARAAGGMIEPEHLPKAARSSKSDPVDALRARLLSPDGDFERDLVEPFFRREIPRAVVVTLFDRFKAEYGGKRGWMTKLAKELRVDSKRLMNFLREQRLLPTDGD
jgi:DNA-binding NtrC family response regulator